MQQGANRWGYQGLFLLSTLAGLMMAALKCAFFLAFRWQQKSPELQAAPPSSPLSYNLIAGYFQMFAVYRLIKPAAFSLSLITRVLVLARVMSLVSVSRSQRVRRIIARAEVCGLIFAAASSVVSCALMWVSTSYTFQVASYSRALSHALLSCAFRRLERLLLRPIQTTWHVGHVSCRMQHQLR